MHKRDDEDFQEDLENFFSPDTKHCKGCGKEFEAVGFAFIDRYSLDMKSYCNDCGYKELERQIKAHQDDLKRIRNN